MDTGPPHPAIRPVCTPAPLGGTRMSIGGPAPITGKACRLLIIALLSLLIGVRATNAQTPDQVARLTKLIDAAAQAYRDGQYNDTIANDAIAGAEQVLALAQQA